MYGQVTHSRPPSAAAVDRPLRTTSTVATVAATYDEWSLFPLTIVNEWWTRWASSPNVTLRPPTRDTLLGGTTSPERRRMALQSSIDDDNEVAKSMLRTVGEERPRPRAQQVPASSNGNNGSGQTKSLFAQYGIDEQWPRTADAMKSHIQQQQHRQRRHQYRVQHHEEAHHNNNDTKQTLRPMPPSMSMSPSKGSPRRPSRRGFIPKSNEEYKGDDYCSSDDDNDEESETATKCDMLEMCSGLIIISRAEFAHKIHVITLFLRLC
jgi:hypothetical protein